jgi:hypothetical protein
MCLQRAPEKYITGAMALVGAALDRADLDNQLTDGGKFVSLPHPAVLYPPGIFLVLNSVRG